MFFQEEDKQIVIAIQHQAMRVLVLMMSRQALILDKKIVLVQQMFKQKMTLLHKVTKENKQA